jgi:hypothetical protein
VGARKRLDVTGVGVRRAQLVVRIIVQGDRGDLQQRIAFGVESRCFDIHYHRQEATKAAGDFRGRILF